MLCEGVGEYVSSEPLNLGGGISDTFCGEETSEEATIASTASSLSSSSPDASDRRREESHLGHEGGEAANAMQRRFYVSKNAVIVNNASTITLADAIDFLVRNPLIRRQIAVAGRDTVVANFTLERQMKSYKDLYTMLYYSKTLQEYL